MMFVECLFWKTVNAVEVMRGGYRGGDGDGRDEDEDEDGVRQDEEGWEAEVQAQVDGDWQPRNDSDANTGAVKKVKSVRKPKKKKHEETIAADVAEPVDDDSGDEIDLVQLMDEQSKKEKERARREKKEQRRKEAEAKERERDRQRRALMAMEDDDEEELQLGEYNEQEMDERRRREQRERDEAAEAEGAEKEWRADEEEVLRREYPLFTALKSRYALMSSRLKSRFTQDEVKRKIAELGLDRKVTEMAVDTDTPPALTRQQLRGETDLHTATTDEEQSEVDTTDIAAENNSPRAANRQIDTAAPPPSPSATSPSLAVPPPRGLRAPNGPAVDVKSLTGSVYDVVSDMARHEHHRPFLQHVMQTLRSCAQQRQQYSDDSKHFAAATLSPSRGAEESTTATARRLKRQRQLLSSLQLVRVAGGEWSVQRQYSAEKLEAVVGAIERGYGNTLDDMAENGTQQAEEEDVGVEEEEESYAEQEQLADDGQDEADDELHKEPTGAVDDPSGGESERLSLPVSTPRETRKRTAALLSRVTGGGGSTSEQAAPMLHAEDEMDDAELADFLRQKRNKLHSHAAARSTPHQQQSEQEVAQSEDATAAVTAAGRLHRGRLRKAAAADAVADEDEVEEAAQYGPTDVPLSTAAVTDTQAVAKRRRVIVDEEDGAEMDVT